MVEWSWGETGEGMQWSEESGGANERGGERGSEVLGEPFSKCLWSGDYHTPENILGGVL